MGGRVGSNFLVAARHARSMASVSTKARDGARAQAPLGEFRQVITHEAEAGPAPVASPDGQPGFAHRRGSRARTAGRDAKLVTRSRVRLTRAGLPFGSPRCRHRLPL